MGKPEAYVEQYLRKRCIENGFICWKFTSPNTAGVPDRIVVANGETFFVELKRSGGKLSKLQVARINEIRNQKVFAAMIDSRDKVDEFVNYISGDSDLPDWLEDARG